MKINLETLARIVEEQVPTTTAACMPEANQIVVRFTNRPDVEVALLTPYYQRKVANGDLNFIDLEELLEILKPILAHK